MKKILIPTLALTIAPLVSLCACQLTPPEPEVHKVKIDSSSDTTDITISTPEITLNQELVIPYEIINQEKALDVDNSWVKFDSSNPLPLEQFSYSNNQVIVPDNQVTTYDITICLKSKPKPVIHTVTFLAGNHGTLQGETTVTVEGNETTLGGITKPTVVGNEGWSFTNWDTDDSTIITNDLTITALYEFNGIEKNLDQGYGSLSDKPCCQSSHFTYQKDINYLFNVDAGVCESDHFGESSLCMLWFQPMGNINAEILEVFVNDKKFEKEDDPEDVYKTPGKYYFNGSGYLYVNDYDPIQKTFTMTVQLKFTSNPINAVAMWKGCVEQPE